MNFPNSPRLREPLRVLTKIIQLFALTKNFNRDQWKGIEFELWRTIARDLSSLFLDRPAVQIWSHDPCQENMRLIASSTTSLLAVSESKTRQDLALSGSVFDFDDELFLFVQRPFLTLSEEEKSLLAAVVDHLAVAREWRSSLEVGFEFQSRMLLLHKITISLHGTLELPEILASTARDLGETLGVSRCFIRRYDPIEPGKVLATEKAYVLAGLPDARDFIFDFEIDWIKELSLLLEDPEREASDLKNSESILYIENINHHPDPDGLLAALNEMTQIFTFLSVPIINNKGIVGSLCFHQCDRARSFSVHELDFIRQVADEAAIAIEHAQMYEQIQERAKTDSLTGLLNKSAFHEELTKELNRSKRSNQNLSIMMIDLDYLKRVNDTYGHIVGDEVLKLLGSKMKQVLRQVDQVARFGGDEFGVILPETSAAGARVLGARLAQEILATVHPVCGSLSASIGVHGSPESALDSEELIEGADMALYFAKRSGKGRMCAFGDMTTEDLENPFLNPQG